MAEQTIIEKAEAILKFQDKKSHDGVTVRQIMCGHDFSAVGISSGNVCAHCEIKEHEFANFWLKRGYRTVSQIQTDDYIAVAMALINDTEVNRITVINMRHNVDNAEIARGELPFEHKKGLTAHEDRGVLLEEVMRLQDIINNIQLYLKEV